MKVLYALFLLAGFGLLTPHVFLGHEFFGDRRRAEIPPSVRQTPGGWRTFMQNHGFRGGK